MRSIRTTALLVLLAVCLAAGLGACRQRAVPVQGPEGALGVAGFFQPLGSRDMLAGYLPENASPVELKVLSALDASMEEILAADGVSAHMGAAAVRQCQEQIVASGAGSRGNALDHWLAVGRCADVDWLLVPQVTYWRERDGSELSVGEAASVTLDLFLVDVRGEGLGGRYHFEETQLSLTENILDAGKFVRRGGRWITALELAREGVARGLKEFGL